MEMLRLAGMENEWKGLRVEASKREKQHKKPCEDGRFLWDLDHQHHSTFMSSFWRYPIQEHKGTGIVKNCLCLDWKRTPATKRGWWENTEQGWCLKTP